MPSDPPGEPAAPRFLTARWTDLVMVNYEVDPALLRGRAPAGTEIDIWEGRTFLSLVGFRFLDTRVLGIPIPFHVNFDEVNLRFYVRRESPRGDIRRGVVFIKEIVPSRAAAWVARALYNENYVALLMRHDVSRPEGDVFGRAAYEWRYRGRWNQLAASFRGSAYLPDHDAEETFITEHYWGYVSQRDGSTMEYRVEHPRWSVWRAGDFFVDIDAEAIYGPELAAALGGSPSSAFVADGSDIIVRKGRKIAVV